MSEQQDGQPGDAEVHADSERVGLSNDLARRFAYHPPTTGSRRMAHEEVRRLCHTLAERLADLVPPGRERSSAFAAVESAMFWSNAGIARLYPSADDQTGPTVMRRGQDVEPAPVPNGTQNPASLVGTDDMPAPDGDPEPVEPVAPQRNVTEPAEAPDRPSLPPELADAWEATPEGGAGQPGTALSDPDTPTSP